MFKNIRIAYRYYSYDRTNTYQELPTLPEHMSSPQDVCEVRDGCSIFSFICNVL
jgi:hypothetical protein